MLKHLMILKKYHQGLDNKCKTSKTHLLKKKLNKGFTKIKIMFKMLLLMKIYLMKTKKTWIRIRNLILIVHPKYQEKNNNLNLVINETTE